MRQLTDKQLRFVEEYLISANATQAAIRAGYSAHTANVIGPQLLHKSWLTEAIAKRQAQRSAVVDLEAARILRELATLALSNVSHYCLDDAYNLALAPDAPPDAMRAVASVRHRVREMRTESGEVILSHDVEFRLWNKNQALTSAMKHLGLLVEHIHHSGSITVDLTEKLSTALEVARVKRLRFVS
jgi:phage terminase small subunit